MQFDGSLNRGLYVAENIDGLVDGVAATSKLPLNQMTAEAWFTIDDHHIEFAGLLAVQQDSALCKRGWALTYGRVTGGESGDFLFHFSIAVEGTFVRPAGGFSMASIHVPGIVKGEWNFISATYNGSFISVYFAQSNHTWLKVEKQACLRPPCGKIVYPAAYHIGNGDSCVAGRTPLTIGTYDNQAQASNSPHIGAIKHVKISNQSFSEVQVKDSHDQISPLMKDTSVNLTEYWIAGDFATTELVKSSIDASDNIWINNSGSSPSISTADAEVSTSFELKGRFGTNQSYVCIFHGRNNVIMESSANISFDGKEGFGYTLSCSTPLWQAGFGSPMLKIKRLLSHNTSVPVWQRLCLRPECGFVPYFQRSPQTDDMRSGLYRPTTSGHSILASTLVGTFVKFGFSVKSYIFEFDAERQAFQKLFNVSRHDLQNEDESPGDDAEVPYFLQDGFGGTELEAWSGASSAFHFTANRGQHYVLVANYWDGFRRNVSSVLLQFDAVSKQFNHVQNIPTFGARRWQRFTFEDEAYFVVANQIGASVAYRWDESSNQLNLSSPVVLNMSNASSVAVFEAHNSTYLAFSSDDQDLMSPDKIFRIEPDSVHGLRAVTVYIQSKSTRGYERSLDVIHCHLSGVEHVIFGHNSTLPSPVLALGSSGAFTQVQSLEIAHVTSLLCFRKLDYAPIRSLNEPAYLVAKQIDAATIVFRWNGTLFLASPTASTHPKDAAGGQVLKISQGAGAVTHFRARASSGFPVDYLLIANAQDSMLYRGQHDGLDGLNGPSSIVVTHKYVYVGCQTSKAIVVFERDDASGRILYRRNSTYFSNYSTTFLSNSISTIDEETDVWNLGFPLQGISAMAVSPAGDKLLTTAYVDNTVSVFSIDQRDGSLALLTWIQDDKPDVGRRLVDGLAGASSISVSKNNDIYVTGAVDRAVTLLNLQADSSIVFKDRIKDGERIISSFPGIRAVDVTDKTDVNIGPVRLADGNADEIWEHSARDSAHFVANGETYVVVAASDEGECEELDAACVQPNGAAALYRWNTSTSSFTTHQLLRTEVEASAVVAFHTQDQDGAGHIFVAIANMVTSLLTYRL